MDRLLSAKSVAALLDCKPGHVYSLISSGALQSVRLSKKMVRIPQSSVEGYVLACQKTAGPQDDTEADGPQSLDLGRASEESRLVRAIARHAKRSAAD